MALYTANVYQTDILSSHQYSGCFAIKYQTPNASVCKNFFMGLPRN